MGKTLTLDYRPRLGCLVPAGIVLCGIGLWVYLYKVKLVRAGGTVLDYRGPVPEGFLWVLVAIFAVFLFIGLVGLVAAIRPARKLIITETGVTCPKNPFSRDVTIPFSEMSEVTLIRLDSGDHIEIRHSGGRLTIVSAMVPYGTFTLLRDALAEYRRQRAATSQGPRAAGSRPGSRAGL